MHALACVRCHIQRCMQGVCCPLVVLHVSQPLTMFIFTAHGNRVTEETAAKLEAWRRRLRAQHAPAASSQRGAAVAAAPSPRDVGPSLAVAPVVVRRVHPAALVSRAPDLSRDGTGAGESFRMVVEVLHLKRDVLNCDNGAETLGQVLYFDHDLVPFQRDPDLQRPISYLL